jgi:integrase
MPGSTTKITKRTVDEAHPATGRYVIWDSQLKGFGLRVAQTGTKTYFVRYRVRGARRRLVVLGRHGILTPDEARNRARVILGVVAAGQDPALGRGTVEPDVTISHVVERFIEEHVGSKRKPKTGIDYTTVLRTYLVPRFGSRAVARVTTAEIAQLHNSMKDRPYQANRMLAIVGSMYTFAARRGLVPKGTNPAEGIDRYRETPRERYLTTDELSRLGEALRLGETVGLPWKTSIKVERRKHHAKDENRRTLFSPEVTLAFRLLLLTGARLREILNLEWRHVDLGRGVLLLPDSKTGRKTIVLSTFALELLSHRKHDSEFVVPGAVRGRPRTDLKKPWQAIQRYAGLEGVRIHDLRHTFASIGAGASLGLPVVGKLLGHSQPTTTARYAHLDADPLRRASNVIGDHISAALSQTDSRS